MQRTASRIDTADLKEQARGLGFDLVGVCPAVEPPHLGEYQRWLQNGYHGTMAYLQDHLPLKEHPNRLLPGARSVIAVALNYNQPQVPREGEPRIARYALGRDYHQVLRGKLRKLASYVQSAHPEAECRPCVDSAPIMERDYANLAGLGWFGKNTMLINSRKGSWFFLGLLLTTVDFEPDAPAAGGCGTCTRCIDACPTGAIVHEEGRWQVDARSCISYLTIEHKGALTRDQERQLGDWTFGCDVCQEVCPFNQLRLSQPDRAQITTEPDFLSRSEMPSLSRIASIEWAEWDELTRGSAMRRAGLEGLRRNAAINLRNGA
jgi:epoxyqueuosine reductase